MAARRRGIEPATKNPSRTDRSSNDRNDRAWRAVKVFRSMVPSFTSFARALTGNNSVMVVPSRETATDGKKIYIMPPIELGDNLKHDTYKCGKRDPETLMMTCKACGMREMIMRRVFHEMGHIILDSIEEPTKYGRKIVKALVHEWHPSSACSHAPAIIKEIDAAPTYYGVTDPFSKHLTYILRAMDDVRVDSRMYLARPGLKVPTEISTRQVFREGIPTPDGSEPTWWRDAPLNAQVTMGLMLLGLDLDIREGYLSDEACEILSDPALADIALRARYSNSPVNPVEVSIELFRVLQNRRVFYVEKCRVPPPPPPPQENNDDSADDAPSTPPEVDGHEPDDAGQQSGPDESSDDASEGGEEDPGEGGTGSAGAGGDTEPEQGDDGGEREPQGGAGDDESSDGTGAGGDPEEAPDDGEFDDGELSEGDGDGSDSTPDGDDSGTSAGEEPGGSDADEPGSEVGTGQDVAEQDKDTEQSGEAGSDGGDTDESDRPSDEGAGGEEQLDMGEGSDPEGEVHPGGDGSASEDGAADSPQPGQDLDPGPAEPTGADADGSQEGDPNPAEAHPDDAEPDGGEAQGDDGVDFEEEAPLDQSVWDEKHGDADMIEAYIDLIHKVGHREEDADQDLLNEVEDELNDGPPPGQFGTIEQINDAIGTAVQQEAVFDLNSHTVTGVQVFEYGDERVNWPPKIDLTNPYRRRRPRLHDASEFMPDQALIGRAVRDARIVFSANKQSKHTGNLKSGQVNRSVLGRRAPVDDPRLFHKRTRPGRRDYEFIMSLDCSGSTMSDDRNPRIKRIAFAQAEVLNRLGIPFAIWGHTGGMQWHLVGNEAQAPSTVAEWNAAPLELWMFAIKRVNEPWNDVTKERLANMPPFAENLDGHTLEFLRKQIASSRATDKIIQYFTDGQMPAANGEEEGFILGEELRKCDRAGIKRLAVGINTTSPTEHGFDTVEVEGDEDIIRVIKHLEKYLVT